MEEQEDLTSQWHLSSHETPEESSKEEKAKNEIVRAVKHWWDTYLWGKAAETK